jgi:hypothetical protein
VTQAKLFKVAHETGKIHKDVYFSQDNDFDAESRDEEE